MSICVFQILFLRMPNKAHCVKILVVRPLPGGRAKKDCRWLGIAAIFRP